MGTIEHWREKINAVDAQLLRLLNRRARLAQRIGRIKHVRGRRLWSPARERAVLERLVGMNPGPLDPRSIQRLFRGIIRESRRCEAVAMRAQKDTTR